ncbi:hypothetical protein MHYP_G00273640 [Metynnis hypsauchen]
MNHCRRSRRPGEGAVPVLFQRNSYTVPVPRPRRKWPSEEPVGDQEPVEENHLADHDYCGVPDPAALDLALQQADELREKVEKVSNKRFIEASTGNMLRVTRARADSLLCSPVHIPCCASQSLQPIDDFFKFMAYLSLGLNQRDLAHRFKMMTWPNYLYTVLGSVCIWMSEKAVFSSYKSHSTFKDLIGVAPHDPATFISALYAGSTSDKQILKESGSVPMVTPGMGVMVDQGFLVDDCVPCKVHRPTFLSRRSQMPASEVRKTQSIAQLWVHVERLICRVKERKLFDTLIPLSITGTSFINLHCRLSTGELPEWTFSQRMDKRSVSRV